MAKQIQIKKRWGALCQKRRFRQVASKRKDPKNAVVLKKGFVV